jgi:hypothetical protein
MLSTGEANRQRRALLREIATEHLKKDRAKLLELRARIRDLKGRRKVAIQKTRAQCRAGAARARDRSRERVQAIRAEARALVQTARIEEIRKARAVCAARKARVHAAALSTRDKRRAQLKAERDFQTNMKRIEAWARNRKRHAHQKVTAAERSQESDDAVRQNIAADLLPLFERVRRSIKGSTRQSRTEAFLLYAAENPNEVIDAQVELSQREITKLIHQEARLSRSVRTARPRPTREELAAIPF